MNYTKIYNNIYQSLKNENTPHEVLHYSCLKITDALQEIYLYSQKNSPDNLQESLNVIESFVGNKNPDKHSVI